MNLRLCHRVRTHWRQNRLYTVDFVASVYKTGILYTMIIHKRYIEWNT